MPKSLSKLTFVQMVCIAVMLICIAVLCFSLLTPPAAEPEQPQNNNYYTPSNALSQETPGDKTADIYTIREYNGVIGVFKNGEDTPYMTESSAVASLPPDDKAIIKKGVTFNSYKEMIEFLQDYE